MQADLLRMGSDIVRSKRFGKARSIPHHFDVDVASHSLNAARRALALCRWLNRHGASLSEEDAVRVSLLHDLGMTNDDVFQSHPKIKAHTHPVESALIAREEFGANDVMLDAILFHMWPIGHVPPHHLLGWILWAADKLSFIQESGNYTARVLAHRMAQARS
ncbi:MAG: HD domain-containing protein [Coriobacteriales bacterium]|nr:HD domain-containing protein [Coriobacteriales bacterium]